MTIEGESEAKKGKIHKIYNCQISDLKTLRLRFRRHHSNA